VTHEENLTQKTRRWNKQAGVGIVFAVREVFPNMYCSSFHPDKMQKAEILACGGEDLTTMRHMDTIKFLARRKTRVCDLGQSSEDLKDCLLCICIQCYFFPFFHFD